MHRPLAGSYDSLARGLLTAAWMTCAAQPALAQTPAYIAAKPDSTVRTFGREVAGRIFSDAYTPARRQAVLRSQKAIPGFDCPAYPQIALAEVIPYPLQPGTVSWIERYVVSCTPRTMRNFLLVLQDAQPRVIELLPGTTNADPRLQRDALQGATGFAAALRPPGCDKRIVTETRLVSKLQRGAPWQERWSFDLCGTKAEVAMTFTPSERGGTDWSAALVK